MDRPLVNTPSITSDSTSTTISQICSTCTNQIFTDTSFGNAWRTLQVEFRTRIRYLTQWSSISSAAASGCVWCKLILSLHEPGDDKKSFLSVEVRLQKDHDDFKGRTNKEKARPRGVESLSLWIDGAPRASWYVYASSSNPAAEYVTARSLVRELSSAGSVDMARASLQRCITGHPECNAASPTAPSPDEDRGPSTRSARAAPTRLIDCGGNDESRIRIVHTEESYTADDRYVALSYVWGSLQTNDSQFIACSSKANVASRMTDGMELHLQPATIRDAVTVTRGLGLRWLWIDAICILQDSPEDKTRELPKMRGIYRGAFVTIIAANATGSSKGFLQVRERGYDTEDPEIPFVIRNNPQAASAASIFLSPVWKQYDESQEPINSRAWCLQERLLSTRALVYASHTLQYRCITETVNIGDGLCAPISGPSGPDLAPLLCSGNVEVLQLTSPAQLRSLWNSIVEEYSWRNLTASTDKLTAIAALADLVNLHYMDLVPRCRYLAGVWYYDGASAALSLIRGFLWFKDYTSILPRPRNYRAPSWSWAAVDGRVVLENIDDRVRESRAAPGEVESCCEVLECVTTLKDTRVSFGEVANGKLRINAAIVKVECDLAQELPNVEWGDNVVGVAFSDAAEQIGAGEVWAVPMVCNNKAGYAEGLLVTRARDECYRRVGYFHSAEESTAVVEWLQLFPKGDMCII